MRICVVADDGKDVLSPGMAGIELLRCHCQGNKGSQ